MGSESEESEKKSPEADESPQPEKEEEEEEEEPVTPEKRGTKRESPEKREEEEEGSSKRPARERKTVERYSAVSPRRLSTPKVIKIGEGAGTKLKDIPNVVFKLSKRKVDENLQALHTILFGRKSNTHYLKRNILQFSGFVWTENKEKNKAKVKEKLDKYTKDKLIDFCELLDIHFPRTSTKKEEVSAKLLEFLESPHVTRDLLLADKEKKVKKRRSRTKVGHEASEDASLGKKTKKHKKSAAADAKKGQKQSSEAAEEVEDEDCGSSDGEKDTFSGEEDNNGLEEESDHGKNEENDDNESEEPQVSKKVSDETEQKDSTEPEDKGRGSPVKKASVVKSNKSPSKMVSKKAAQLAEDEQDVDVDNKQGFAKEQTKKSSKAKRDKVASGGKDDKKKSSRKTATLETGDSGPSKSSKSKEHDKKKGQNKEKELLEEKKSSKKKEPAPKVSTKEQGKGKKKLGPSTEELHSVVTSILKEVDFNTATLADILKQLGAHFQMDLMSRKAEVKGIIEDVINNMTDEEDGDGGEDNSGDNQENEDPKEDESDRDGKE